MLPGPRRQKADGDVSFVCRAAEFVEVFPDVGRGEVEDAVGGFVVAGPGVAAVVCFGVGAPVVLLGVRWYVFEVEESSEALELVPKKVLGESVGWHLGCGDVFDLEGPLLIQLQPHPVDIHMSLAGSLSSLTISLMVCLLSQRIVRG